MPNPRVALRALRNRAARWIGRSADPFADTPAGLALSPSARHFAAYETAPLMLRFSNGRHPDVAQWQKVARAKLGELAGYGRGPDPPTAANDANFELGNSDVRRRLYLRAGKGVDIPIHIIAPRDRGRPAPVMLCLQGTNSGAHLSWGEIRFPDDADKSSKGYDFARQAAARGYLAVAVEQSCFGERAERVISPRSPGPCVDATMHALLLGRSLMGERCSDVSAVIDWITANADALGADARRIHVMGHSAGGSVALFAAALDERIGATLACGCLGYIRETIGRRRDSQGQNVVPGILNWMEMADVVGLVAPRAFATVAGENDHIWPAAGAMAVADEARGIYARMGAERHLRCVSAPGGHKFRPRESWQALHDALAS